MLICESSSYNGVLVQNYRLLKSQLVPSTTMRLANGVLMLGRVVDHHQHTWRSRLVSVGKLYANFMPLVYMIHAITY